MTIKIAFVLKVDKISAKLRWKMNVPLISGGLKLKLN
jgi:hypothetical protein